MRALFLGGTSFVGRAMVEDALARGWEVVLFHRGQTGASLFPDLKRYIGNRDTDLGLIPETESFDVVVDTSAYFPHQIDHAIEHLSAKTKRYFFISTISIMLAADPDEVLDENAQKQPVPEDLTTLTGETYGGLKVECENRLRDHFGDRLGIVRPGLIIGPHDKTERFTYWPVRYRDDERVVMPGRPEEKIQVIDVRDLAAFSLNVMEKGLPGPFMATSPAYSWKEVAEACGHPEKTLWVDGTWAEEQGLKPWEDFPLWTGPVPSPVMSSSVIARAQAEGLTARPLVETIRDLMAYDPPSELKAGMKNERHQELVKAALEAGYK